jgi:serine/threonine-protein kinase
MLERPVIDFAHLAPGQQFAGRYAIVRLLKAGGMGAVFEATHLATHRRVALKVMRPELVVDKEERARFVREAQVATLIESSHVVDVLDAGVDEASAVPFIVMEFLAGEELGDYLEKHGRAAPDACVRWLAQAARALDKAHAKGVVHRDLKPENLFLVLRDGEPPTIKILDYGIAKLVQSASATGTRATGTPLYMAPEQTRRSSQIAPATDIWALGLVAYTLLVGRTYWEGEDINQLLTEILFDPLESPRARAARAGVALPPTFDAWFFGCVERDPNARFRRASDAITALAAVFGINLDAGTPTSLPTGAPSHPAYAATNVSVHPPPPFPPPFHPPPPPPQLAPPPSPAAYQAAAFGHTTSTPVTERADPAALPGAAGGHKSSKGLVLAIVVAGVLVGGGLAVGLAMRGGSGESASAADDPSPASTPSKPKPTSEPAKPEKKPKSFAEVVAQRNAWVSAAGLESNAHEVTREEYGSYLGTLDGKAKKAATPIQAWREPDDAIKRLPVTWVTWEQADGYCRAAGARLPTSDEWGKLLGKGFPWGTAWPPPSAIAVGRGESAEPIEVATITEDKTSGALYDLAGNVQEWTSTVKEGLAVARGASISMAPDDAKAAIETGLEKWTVAGAGADAAPESIAGARLGFRCVRAPK